MRTFWIVPALVVAGALVAPPQTAAKLPLCPGGRYLVAGSSLMPGLDAASPDVVDVAGRMVSVLSGCGPVKAKVRATGQGTKIRARWKSCPSITGKAILVATITEQ